MPHGGLGFHFQSEKVGEGFAVPCPKIANWAVLSSWRTLSYIVPNSPILFQCLGVVSNLPNVVPTRCLSLVANLPNIVPMSRRCRKSALYCSNV